MCGGSSPLSPVVDAVENLSGSIGDAGATIDNAVNENVPGGWVTVGAAALGGAGALGAFGELGAGGLSAGEGAGFVGPSSSLASATGDAFLPGALAADGAGATTGSVGAGAAALGEGTAQLGAGTSLSADAATNPLNPYYGVGADASNPLITNAGYGSSELGGAGSIIGSGTGLGVATLPEVSAATGFGGLTATDLATPSGTSTSDIARALRAANTAKNLFAGQKLAQQNMQQSFNKLNGTAQSGTQGTGLPAEYRAKNPFDFGQQQPVQDQLASLLRNNYG
jgi:hypothetical protein